MAPGSARGRLSPRHKAGAEEALGCNRIGSAYHMGESGVVASRCLPALASVYMS